MKVYALDNGRLENDFAQIVNLTGIATASNKDPKANWISQPVWSVLIEHEDGYILFDCGVHPDAMKKRWPTSQKESGPYIISSEDQLLPNTLKSMGISCDDIKYVVCSHLHEDHAGCLEYFKNARIFVNEFEFTMAMKTYGLGKQMGAYIADDIEQWVKNKLNWELLDASDDNMKLAEGVTLLNFGPGHTYGMLGLLLELENDQNIILASDTVFTSMNYGPPARFPAVVYDSIGYMQTVKRIHKLSKEKNAVVWFGHDMAQFDSLKKYPEYYS